MVLEAAVVVTVADFVGVGGYAVVYTHPEADEWRVATGGGQQRLINFRRIKVPTTVLSDYMDVKYCVLDLSSSTESTSESVSWPFILSSYWLALDPIELVDRSSSSESLILSDTTPLLFGFIYYPF